MAVNRRRRPCVRAHSPAPPPARASPSSDPGAQQDPFPAILPVVRFGLPNLGYPDPACRTAAAAPAALPWDRRASRIAWPTGERIFRVRKPDRRPRGLRGPYDLPSIAAGACAGAEARIKAFLVAPAGRPRHRRLKSAMSRLLVVMAGVALTAIVGCGGSAPRSAS